MSNEWKKGTLSWSKDMIITNQKSYYSDIRKKYFNKYNKCNIAKVIESSDASTICIQNWGWENIEITI